MINLRHIGVGQQLIRQVLAVSGTKIRPWTRFHPFEKPPTKYKAKPNSTTPTKNA